MRSRGQCGSRWLGTRPNPSTLNPKPYTLNPHSTLNPQPSTLNSEPGTRVLGVVLADRELARLGQPRRHVQGEEIQIKTFLAMMFTSQNVLR